MPSDVPRLRVTAREWRRVAIYTLALLVITTIPYLIAFGATGDQWRFTGFLFGVEDGSSYLGKMRLGARGLWFKMNFFEGAARVPLIIAAPGVMPARIETPVSTIDMTPTLADLAGVSMAEVMPWTDGTSLLPLMRGEARTAPVAMEYAAEGTIAPMVALRRGDWKYIACAADPE
ncbi:MAG: sulfatase-like hydrolase/transferase, partial [Blastochloris sp.]|nr:sulfatase-like hydrolase/transferase [Blastochloris sp.]